MHAMNDCIRLVREFYLPYKLTREAPKATVGESNRDRSFEANRLMIDWNRCALVKHG